METPDRGISQHRIRRATGLRQGQKSRIRRGFECYKKKKNGLFNSELSLTQTKEVLFQALVNLCKAMGGGWVLEVDHLTETTTGSKISTRTVTR